MSGEVCRWCGTEGLGEFCTENCRVAHSSAPNPQPRTEEMIRRDLDCPDTDACLTLAANSEWRGLDCMACPRAKRISCFTPADVGVMYEPSSTALKGMTLPRRELPVPMIQRMAHLWRGDSEMTMAKLGQRFGFTPERVSRALRTHGDITAEEITERGLRLGGGTFK